MVIQKRQLLWDWTNSAGPNNPGVPKEMDNVPFGGNSPMSSVNNWNVWAPPELKGRAPFRPMIRGLGQVSGGDWSIAGNSPYPIFLFFNEPERAGITPEHARDIWYKQMLPLRQNKAKKLGSPAVASDPEGYKWLEKWMDLVAKDPPDYLCLHYYSHNADDGIKYITDMHKKYPKPQVMVTEIACIDRNYNTVLEFTVKVCNWMDQQPWIFEYGLFDFQRTVADNFVSPAAQLMHPDGHFTQLGLMYLHDQPMKMPVRPRAVVQEVEINAIDPIETPTPPQHGPEDEAIHGTATDIALQTNGASSTNSPSNSDSSTSSTSEIQPLSTDNGNDNNNMPSATLQTLLSTTASLTSDQATALQLHNSARATKKLQPLSWDATLASHAQEWANQLVRLGKLQHSTGEQRPGQGENLAWAMASGGVHDPLAGATRMWLDEAKNYHGEPIGQGNFASYGHYTQCMWHSTTKVGMASAKDAKGGTYTVGRYSPPGNWTGQKPF